MKKLENCNYAVDLARSMGFSVVGIGGSDLRDGSKLTLGECVHTLVFKGHSEGKFLVITEMNRAVERVVFVE